MRQLMRPMSRLMIAAACVLALAACGGGGGEGPAAGTSAEGGRTMGKADAPVKVVEYASMACHFCADFNNKEFPAFKAKYIDTGKVLYELREMPHASPNLSAAGFLMAACTGDKKYFQTVDAFYKELPNIAEGRISQTDGLAKVAAEVGLSEQAMQKCITDEDALRALAARMEANTTRAPGGTPQFYVNDVEYTGENTAAGLGAAVDAAAAK